MAVAVETENYLQLEGITDLNYMAMYNRRVNALPVAGRGLISDNLVPDNQRRYGGTFERLVIVDVVAGGSTGMLRSFVLSQQQIARGALVLREGTQISRYELGKILIKHVTSGRPWNKQVVIRLSMKVADWERKSIIKETYFEDRVKK